MKVIFLIIMTLTLSGCFNESDNKKVEHKIAQQLIGEGLKSPSSASFRSFHTLYEKTDSKYHYFIVKAEVDAPNSFGVMLREKYCAAFKVIVNDEEGKFTWNRDSYLSSCDERKNVSEALIIDILKQTNNFP